MIVQWYRVEASAEGAHLVDVGRTWLTAEEFNADGKRLASQHAIQAKADVIGLYRGTGRVVVLGTYLAAHDTAIGLSVRDRRMGR